MMQDLITDAISDIKNYERAGKSICAVKPTSKLLIDILKVFQREGYIGEFELEDNNRGGIITIKLIKKINDCGVIKPRFPVKHADFTKWEKQYLPARGFGILVVSTPGGIITHKEAKEKGSGGRLLAYVY